MRYTLRPVTAADDAIQRAIYASTRDSELALTDWSPAQRDQFVRMQHEAQQRHYASHFPQARCQLILVDGAVAGRLWVHRREGVLHILDIALLPDFRGHGLGAACLTALQAEAAADGLDLSIYVEVHNPAQRLYRRLGFVSEGLIQGVHQSMRWSAPSPVLEESTP